MQVLLKQLLFCQESACSILPQISLTMIGEFHFIDPQILFLFHFKVVFFYVHIVLQEHYFDALYF